MSPFITIMFDIVLPGSRGSNFSTTGPYNIEVADKQCTGHRIAVIHPGNRSLLLPWTMRDLTLEAIKLIHNVAEQNFLTELLLHSTVITNPDDFQDKDFYVVSLANLRSTRGGDTHQPT